jgi:hypothetical protein
MKRPERAYLATTNDETLWDHTRQLLYLGRWCVPSPRTAATGRADVRIVPSPWQQPGYWERTFAYLDALSERFLASLAQTLNSHHGLHWSLRAWRMVLGNWLFHAIHFCYDRWLHMDAALRLGVALTTRVHPLSTALISRTTPEFKCRQLAAPGQLDVISLLLWVLRDHGADVVFEPNFCAPPAADSAALGRVWRQTKIALRSKLDCWRLAGLRCGATKVTFAFEGFPHQTQSALLSEMDGCAAVLKIPAVPLGRRAAIDLEARRKALKLELADPDPFEKVFADCLSFLLPSSYFEDFREWLRHSEELPGHGLKHLVTAYGFSGDELAGFWLARLHANGTRIYGLQHGGGYGAFSYCPEELHERRCSDGYLTWGWKDDAKDTPLPAPVINGALFQRSKTQPRSKVLFVSTDRPGLTHRVQSHPLSGELSDYFDWQRRFIAALNAQALRHFVYRPYPESYGNQERNWYQDNARRLAIDGGPFSNSISNSSLIIFDHHGTGFLKTLASNIPTVVFWKPFSWPLRESAVPHFDRLRAARIFFQDPEKAARHVNAVADCPMEWWGQADVQEAVDAFTRIFARRCDDWARQWRDWVCSLD